MFSSSHERAIRICLTAIAASSLLALAGIVIFLFTEGLPLFRHVSPLDFLLGDLWYPTEDPGLFGIFPLLVGSVAVTVLSSLLAVPLGVMTAVYLAEIAPPFARRVIKPFVELLAALPSVVLGFLGMVVLAPILQDVLGAATGLNLLNASLVLAIMSLPTICSVSEDALRAVPRSLREASLALGATRWETIVRVVVPAALSGIGPAPWARPWWCSWRPAARPCCPSPCWTPCGPCPPPSPPKWLKPPSAATITTPCSPQVSSCS